MANTKYSDALSLLSRDNQWGQQDEDILLLTAVCQYQLNRLDEAERILNRLIEAEDSPYPDPSALYEDVYVGEYPYIMD